MTDELWKLAAEKTEVLQEENFTGEVIIRLKEFESSLLKAMTKDGWDGDEDPEKVQWTFTGALFYSIIVITTIGNLHLEIKVYIRGKSKNCFEALKSKKSHLQSYLQKMLGSIKPFRKHILGKIS